jgi:membrane protease YdiL (CAAX protease family)
MAASDDYFRPVDILFFILALIPYILITESIVFLIKGRQNDDEQLILRSALILFVGIIGIFWGLKFILLFMYKSLATYKRLDATDKKIMGRGLLTFFTIVSWILFGFAVNNLVEANKTDDQPQITKWTVGLIFAILGIICTSAVILALTLKKDIPPPDPDVLQSRDINAWFKSNRMNLSLFGKSNRRHRRRRRRSR